jgi:endonuclease/exonuclease/phosphatase family metal-dependent hydrolase
MELKLLTFNIHHGKGLDKRVNLERIAKIIKVSEADIIGLNEVDVTFGKRSHFKNQAAILSDLVKMNYVFGPVIRKESRDHTEGEYGNVILSRLKINSHSNHMLFTYSYLAEPRGVLEAKFEVLGKIISVFVTHLSINPFLQRKQLMDLENIFKGKNNVVLMGDLNIKPLSKNYSTLCRILKDTIGKEEGFTYPSKNPRKKLDYIFVSQEIAVMESKVLTDFPEASDHLPLMTKIFFDHS